MKADTKPNIDVSNNIVYHKSFPPYLMAWGQELGYTIHLIFTKTITCICWYLISSVDTRVCSESNQKVMWSELIHDNLKRYKTFSDIWRRHSLVQDSDKQTQTCGRKLLWWVILFSFHWDDWWQQELLKELRTGRNLFDVMHIVIWQILINLLSSMNLSEIDF